MPLFLSCATLLVALSAATIPCDQSSDFYANKTWDIGLTCQDAANIYSISVDQCGENSKARMIMELYTACCKPYSKPNGMCGFKLTLPCDKDDFDGTKVFGGHQAMYDGMDVTCREFVPWGLPSSVEECDAKVEDYAKFADNIKYAYINCCKSGSKPNGMCGFKVGTATPCKSKASAEFLPAERISGDSDYLTCAAAQQFGYFDLDDPAGCDKHVRSGTDDNTTVADMLTMAATSCCQSKEPDQTVCKVNPCLYGLQKCLFGSDPYDGVRDNITDPKGMVMEDGKLRGSCRVALANRVEGALCCNDEMRKHISCLKAEVGDIAPCKDSWNNHFGPSAFNYVETFFKPFQAGGYCAGPTTTATTTTTTTMATEKDETKATETDGAVSLFVISALGVVVAVGSV